MPDLPIQGSTTTLTAPDLDEEWLQLAFDEISPFLNIIAQKLALHGCQTATIKFENLWSELIDLAREVISVTPTEEIQQIVATIPKDDAER